MATEIVSKSNPARDPFSDRPVKPTVEENPLRIMLMPLASLKLTVALFALSILLTLFGTLAQDKKDMWEVMAQYFAAWIAVVEFSDLFPTAWFPAWLVNMPGSFPFPGGKLIGAVMAVNLLAAHGLRFKFQAKGGRLAWGLAVIALGVFITWLVIASGHNSEGLQGVPFFPYWVLWLGFKLVGLAAVLAAGFFVVQMYLTQTPGRSYALRGLLILAGGVVVLLFTPTLSDSSMRILWQLVQGGLAGLVLLAGCWLVFKKRGGIVLLHGGVGLMLLALYLGLAPQEHRMAIKEGETVNFARDIRTTELAVIDDSDPKEDVVVVVPKSHLKEGKTVSHELLPFDVEVIKTIKNADLRRLKPGEEKENLATAGIGKDYLAIEYKPAAGADASGAVDMAASYVKFTDKEGKNLGVYLLSQIATSQEQYEQVEVDGKTYDVGLRFKRIYKPYSLTLLDVRKDDYMGTEKPRNYSSDVRLVDPTRNEDREVKIWMNNPLRYAGETFYQSNYNKLAGGIEQTDLQVVANTGWMIPYVACMIVMIGMLGHFPISLIRFLKRRAADMGGVASSVVNLGVQKPPLEESKKAAKRRRRHEQPEPATGSGVSLPAIMIPLVLALLCGGWMLSKLRPPAVPADGMNIHAFGELPVMYQGRIQPYDTLARNTLRIISKREIFKDHNGAAQPAIRWLLDVITDADAARKHKVFRIENLEVLGTLGLERRSGFRYAIEEFSPKMDEFIKQAKLASSVPGDQLNTYQRKILELDRNLRRYMLLVETFQPPNLPPLPTPQEFEKDRALANEKIEQFQLALVSETQRLRAMQPPLAIPAAAAEKDAEDQWFPYASAWALGYVQTQILGRDAAPGTAAFNGLLVAYRKGDAVNFNREVDAFAAELRRNPPDQLAATPGIASSMVSSMANTFYAFEAKFNHVAPFYLCTIVYLLAGLLAFCGFLGFPTMFNRSAFWIIVVALAVHTLALVARIYISGRPPVTNLYSSAIFIGWCGVLLGLVLEAVYKIGVGNLMAAVTGFTCLLIAYFLAGDGDTFVVLQAVLDTQFWLATHVTCITLGYATTFLAGLLGILFIVLGLFTPELKKIGKDITRMIYGILCFALFFSFVGTVLGGLWADDSWGRFWGWDPKENGALIIVLWNALILHARWGAMVKDRGLAVLAVAGNIVTSWSWFGVNELGVGLHSYGFTEGALLALLVFWSSQIGLIFAGCIPKQYWRSFQEGPLLAERVR